MKFFIDTANLAQIREANALGVLDGVTTNPSLMAKEGIKGVENQHKHYIEICNIVDGDVSAEVIATDYEGMIREGEELAALNPHIVVKVPCIEDGTSSLYFDKIRFAYFDCMILQREGAEKDYTDWELQQVRELDKTITETEKNELVDTIIVKTQGFVNGNIKEGDRHPVAIFRRLLSLYDGIDRDALRENLRYFLQAVMPVCDEYGINMCIHPDDPPFQVLGLPRIVTSEKDITWLLHAVDNSHNGLTFCAGSLSAGLHNNVPSLARMFAHRTHFVHLRSTNAFPNGNFIEASHLGGRAHVIELIRIFEKERPGVPMRVDHGRMMLDDAGKGYNPGYSFHGRMMALAQIEGMMAVINEESKLKS